MIFRFAAKDRRKSESRLAEDRRRRRLRPTLLALEERRQLSSIVVNNPTDTPVTRETDLRQAIDMANTNGGDETITFDSKVFGSAQTIELASGQLELSDTTGTVTITGPKAGVTISGGGLSRVFQVDEAVQASVSGCTLADGIATYGGAAYNLGTLDLSHCLFEDNVTKPAGFRRGAGAAIANEGGATLSLTDCTLIGNSVSGGGGFGGAIWNRATATLTDCSLSGNSAPLGGAIRNSGGVLTLSGCQLEGNTAPPVYFVYGNSFESGPGIGGAILSDGPLKLVDCTLTGNSANGGGGAIFDVAYSAGSGLSLTDCTLKGNSAQVGGAIDGGVTSFSITGCTLTGNSTGTSGGALAIDSGTTSLEDCTLSGNATGGIGGAVRTTYGTLIMGGLHPHRELRRAGRRRCGDRRYGISDGLHHP
jgi:hypothetical protein